MPEHQDILAFIDARQPLMAEQTMAWANINSGSRNLAGLARMEEVLREGHNGRLVDFFDVDGWSRVLTECLADPARFGRLRVQARRTAVERYDLSRVCLPKMIALVEGLGPKG